MATKQKVKAAIDKAGTAFEECWATLCALRNMNVSDRLRDQLLSFQPVLARAIHDLDRMHLQTRVQHRKTILNKKTIWSKTFRARLRALDHYDSVIVDTLKIAKSLGDSFAWFFYRDEKVLLTRHLQHQLVKHTPGGVGGKGELAFVEGQQVSNGHLVLYHGNTTILRIGDISFIDLKTFRVTGLGELKSYQSEPGVVTVSATMLGPTPKIRSVFSLTMPDKQLNELPSRRPIPSPKMKDQLQRQLHAMAKAFEPKKSSPNIAVEADTTHDALIRLSKALDEQVLAYEKCGDGLLLMGMRQDLAVPFSSRVFGSVKGRTNWDFGSLGDCVRSIIDTPCATGENWNSISIGGFSPSVLPGTIPFCSWTIDPAVIKKILFQEILVIAIYNSAFLIKKLQGAGYTVKRTGRRDDFEASKPFGAGQMIVPEWTYFVHLITNHFIGEETIVQTLSRTEAQMILADIQPHTKVIMEIELDPPRGVRGGAGASA